jgi:hypothetical protein
MEILKVHVNSCDLWLDYEKYYKAMVDWGHLYNAVYNL